MTAFAHTSPVMGLFLAYGTIATLVVLVTTLFIAFMCDASKKKMKSLALIICAVGALGSFTLGLASWARWESGYEFVHALPTGTFKVVRVEKNEDESVFFVTMTRNDGAKAKLGMIRQEGEALVELASAKAEMTGADLIKVQHTIQ